MLLGDAWPGPPHKRGGPRNDSTQGLYQHGPCHWRGRS